jgi:uncharacterized protein
METRKTILAIFVILFAALPSVAFAYTTQIHAPAVLQNEDLGVLTTIQLNITSGNGTVDIKGPSVVGSSTIASAQSAAIAAASYLGLNESKYKFTYYIENSVNVSGPSGGLALTLLAVYALKNAQLYSNFTVTGTITNNGSVGPIGGIYDKAQAAKQNGMNYILVPTVQNGSTEDLLYYISQQMFGIPLFEVSNLSQALPYTRASGHLTPGMLRINLTQYYNTSIHNSSIQCKNCNESYFVQLTNYTLGYVTNETEMIPSNFTSAKDQLLSNLKQYSTISDKGYLYTGADLAFVEYATSYTLAHSNSYTKQSAIALATNVSDYCALLSPPQLTAANYEYVVGGELRQSLGIATLNESIPEINSSASTDTIIEAMGSVAEAQAWCSAANEMYNIASEIGGSPVYESSSMKNAAMKIINISEQYPGIYLTAAKQDYSQGEYSAALYGATYAKALASAGPSNYSTAMQTHIAGVAYNATNGVWPAMFADSAMFYLQQANYTKNSTLKMGYISSAYSLANLASYLSGINGYISKNLIPGNSTSTVTSSSTPESSILLTDAFNNESRQIMALGVSVVGIHGELEVFAVLLLIFLIIILIMLARINKLIKISKFSNQPRSSGRENGRARRRM